MATATGVREADREEVRRLLREDFTFYPPEALKIVNMHGDVVPFILKPPQLRLNRGLMAQRAAGQPMRAQILKPRKTGFSTDVQGILVQRTTQLPNHYSLVVAQDTKTAGEIFGIGRFMWANLPAQIRPELAYERNSRGGMKFMQFGEPAQLLRRQGLMGLNSTIEISTARDVDAGRGLTIRSLHLSEVAFWPPGGDGTSGERKMLALLNAVPDVPDTLIVKESTPNGHNFFKDDWDAAEAGESGYLAIFTPWFEEPTYTRPFANEGEREEFRAGLCEGPYGEDEEDLLVRIPASLREWARELGEPEPSEEWIETRTLEALNWRRWAIQNKTGRSVSKFHQEYASTPEEAFLSTGRRVWEVDHVRRVLQRTAKTDPADGAGVESGLFRPLDAKVTRVARGTTIEVPQRALWVPRRDVADGERARWRIFAPPQPEVVENGAVVTPAGQYIVGVDPMSGEENEGKLANHAIEVIDHRTLEQVAEYESQVEPDQVALEALLVALAYNRAWISVERTGGWGMPILSKLARDYHYPRLIETESADTRTPNRQDRLGWSTDPKTKPMMEARTAELLRDGVDGIRSRRVASQMLTYVRNARGRSGPEAGKLADALMAWQIAQMAATLRPIRPERPRGATSYTGRKVRDRRTGW